MCAVQCENIKRDPTASSLDENVARLRDHYHVAASAKAHSRRSCRRKNVVSFDPDKVERCLSAAGDQQRIPHSDGWTRTGAILAFPLLNANCWRALRTRHAPQSYPYQPHPVRCHARKIAGPRKSAMGWLADLLLRERRRPISVAAQYQISLIKEPRTPIEWCVSDIGDKRRCQKVFQGRIVELASGIPISTEHRSGLPSLKRKPSSVSATGH